MKSRVDARRTAVAERSGDVTIVIATYNRARYLPEALQSFLAQTLPASRIIVVDDGSTDDTANVVTAYAGQVEYVRQENGGKAKALNGVIPSISTEFVWFFDDDDAVRPDAIESLIMRLTDDTAVAFCFGAYSVSEADSDLLQRGQRSVPYPHAEAPPQLQRLALFRSCNIQMSGAILRTDAVRAVGGFDEAMLRGQDYDLMIRLAARYPHRYCGREVYVVRIHDSQRGPDRERHSQAERGRVWAKYNALIGEKMMRDFPLSAFQYGKEDIDQSPPAKRRALIIRAWSMATKLGTARAVADILDAFDEDGTTPLMDIERRVLTETFNHEFLSTQSHRAALRLLRLLGKPAGRTALMLLGRGLYWGVSNQPTGWRGRSFSSLVGALLYGLAYLASRRDHPT